MDEEEVILKPSDGRVRMREGVGMLQIKSFFSSPQFIFKPGG
jgi:hypothetical protein